MKKFIAEFKAFALRGNIVDMAVGVIIGGAFTGIITAFTDSFINPLLNVILTEEKFSLYALGLNFANFIAAILNFLIMAFILFLFVKSLNKVVSLGRKKEEEKPTVKKCPYCKSTIDIEATRCPHCTSKLES